MSRHFPKEVETALYLISEAKLAHPLGPLLQCFVIDALDPRLAARFILQRCQGDQSPKDLLLRIVSDWKYIVESRMFDSTLLYFLFVLCVVRSIVLICFQVSPHGVAPPPPDAACQSAIRKRDADMCCITGKPGRLCDPLVIIPILPVPSRWAHSEVCLCSYALDALDSADFRISATYS